LRRNTEGNIRPAQWLGLLKVLTVWGAEFFYAGFFSLSTPFPIPANWVWQAAMPSYAQALVSQTADFYFKSEPLRGDCFSAWSLEVANYQMHGPGYLLWAGAPNRVAIARKHVSLPVYMLTATVQRTLLGFAQFCSRG
jgi:hypothetical protein